MLTCFPTPNLGYVTAFIFQAGEILLDDVPLEEYNVGWLRSAVGLVAQQPDLLPGTIYENIVIGKNGASESDVHEAAKFANAHAFIMAFPNGYSTEASMLARTYILGNHLAVAWGG